MIQKLGGMQKLSFDTQIEHIFDVKLKVLTKMLNCLIKSGS